MKIICKDIDFITDEIIIVKKQMYRDGSTPRKQKNRTPYVKRTQAELDREREDRLYRNNWKISNIGSKAKSQRVADLNLKYGL
jgi:hypothetical protein